MHSPLLLLLLVAGLAGVLGRPKSWREGPIVDPGVFVITQIKADMSAVFDNGRNQWRHLL